MEWATFEVSEKFVLAVGGLCYPVILAGAATDSVDLLLTQIGSLLSLVKLPVTGNLNFGHADSSIIVFWCKQYPSKLLVCMRVSPDKLQGILSGESSCDNFVNHCKPYINDMCSSPEHLDAHLEQLFAHAEQAFLSQAGISHRMKI